MRAAYGAIILGILGGLWLATRALSAGAIPAPATVAAALAVDAEGLDIDARRSEAVAVLVARCMQARGLEWQPWVEPPPTVPDAELDPVGWAERWGFGVSTTVGRETGSPALDPNLAGMAASPSERRERLREALDGTGETAPGCQRATNEAVYGLRDRLLGPLRPALMELDARIAADPDATRALEAWRACVEPIAGGAVGERREFTERLMLRFEAETQRVTAAPSNLVGLFALQTEERRVAATLARCEARYAAARAAVAGPYEVAFVAQHRDELRRIGTAIRDAEAALPRMSP